MQCYITLSFFQVKFKPRYQFHLIFLHWVDEHFLLLHWNINWQYIVWDERTHIHRQTLSELILLPWLLRWKVNIMIFNCNFYVITTWSILIYFMINHEIDIMIHRDVIFWSVCVNNNQLLSWCIMIHHVKPVEKQAILSWCITIHYNKYWYAPIQTREAVCLKVNWPLPCYGSIYENAYCFEIIPYLLENMHLFLKEGLSYASIFQCAPTF